MLNLNPTNLEDNGDTPEVVVESASEDDEIDISQFVESVLEEPAEPAETIEVCPPLVFTSNTPKAQFVEPRKLIGTLTPVTVTTGRIQTVPALHYPAPVNNIHRVPGPANRAAPRIIRRILGPSNPTIVPNFTWLRDCFSKMKNSSLTLNYQVKCLEDRFKTISRDTDPKKVVSLATDLQTLLKQTELGYKYLGTELASAQRAYAQNITQKTYANMNKSNVLVRRQVLLPVSPERKLVSPNVNTSGSGISLPPNMVISVNGNNHSLSITVENDTIDVSALCAKFNINPCYVLLERCDASTESDCDEEVQIIEELIAL